MTWRLALVLMVTASVASCMVSPAVRKGVEVTACRYMRYVQQDPMLTPEQKAIREDMARELRREVGLPEQCSDVGQ
jgi:hypothetical protein